MAPTNLEKAKGDRDVIASTITWLQNKVNAHATTPLTLVEVDHYLRELEAALNDVKEVHKRILINAPTDIDDQNREYFRLLDLISKLQCYLKALKARSSAAASTSSSSTSSSTQDIRLPRMELPTFDGSISSWISYRDMFLAAVGGNSHLTNVQKLTYLKSSVSGEAARQVRSLPITDSNFSIAWKLLEERYHNERELLFSILRRFTGQPTIQSSSAVALRSLIDTTKECMRSLEVLKLPVSQWDAIILFLLHQKLDTNSRELWEQSLKDKNIPSLKDFLEFLEQRASALAASGTKQFKVTSHPKSEGVIQRHAHHVQAGNEIKCKLCSGDHMIFKCSVFLNYAVQERINFIKRENRCFNCLRFGHPIGNCLSKHSCRTCSRRHHTLLHKQEPAEKSPQRDPPQQQPSGSTINHHINNENIITNSILATALVQVTDNHGGTQYCRALLDSGSTSSFITENCAQRLGLRRQQTSVQVKGLCSTSVGNVKGSVTLTVHPHFDATVSYIVNGLILTKVTANLPVDECDPSIWPHINDIQLADPEFHKPAEIDLLFGADLFYDILHGQQRQGPANTPSAIKTALGWLIGGKISQAAVNVVSHHADIDLNSTLEKFWSIETVPEEPIPTEEHEECEQHFETSFQRDLNGRFMVKLPFKGEKNKLGSSREIAIRRLKGMERRLSSQPHYKNEYVTFMTEYRSLGHMRKIQDENRVHASPQYYIPHHFVLKESSSTTKFRIVFNASSATSSGTSLNDILRVGPILQDNITDIIMRFRTHTIAFTADIAKMYRQIKISEEDLSMQRIVWRDDPTKPVEDYELLTVTYGTASAPYLATKALQKLAELEGPTFPLAAQVLKEDFYVDDCLSGESNLERATVLQSQLNSLLQRGGFNLRKWSSNSSELIQQLPPGQRETKDMQSLFTDDTIKTLGIHWSPSADQFSFKVNVNITSTEKLTKRKILSEMAKLYDPLGWLQPVIIAGKIGMQKLWKLNCGWDDVVPHEIQLQWHKFFQDLQNIEQIKIPRHINPHSSSNCDLIGFSDSSIVGYSGVTYIRFTSESHTHLALVASKTKVAPAKGVTLPRLELCGALLLSSLMVMVMKAHNNYTFKNIYAFTDSTITLAWISAHPSKWKTFVQNRVAKIQANIPAKHWRHVAGKDNPADCASRGISASELSSHPLWWTGPPWLANNNMLSPHTIGYTTEELQERNENVFAVEVTQSCLPIFKFSSFTKLKRVTAWVLRFLFNSKQRTKLDRRSLELQPRELEDAQSLLIRFVQQEVFSSEYGLLCKGLQVLPKSKLISLAPFMDSNKCIRVGGRIQNGNAPENQKHPLVLPRHHHFTNILIYETHRKNGHAGPQLLQCILQQQFWILRSKDAIRFSIKKCTICARLAAKTAHQMMGNLPSARVNPSRPFTKTGVDFCGPIIIKPMVRSKVTIKVYIAIFICLCTRAIHIEVVSSLSTEAFLASFKRFVSRRGKPTDMYSDQGTNFVGAARVLGESLRAVLTGDNLLASLSTEGINWHFNPASASHFGGIWEAGVKSIKFHLFRIIGLQKLTFEELCTVLCQIESILNSRPLTSFSSDPSELTALTPGHFLIGAPLTAPPEPELLTTPVNRLARWQLLQQMQQGFWKRWSNEFITRLQQRPKWLGPQRNLEENDMVIIKDERLRPLMWKLGRVIACHPGGDGLTRVVSVRTADGVFKRPVVKLCLLPLDS